MEPLGSSQTPGIFFISVNLTRHKTLVRIFIVELGSLNVMID